MTGTILKRTLMLSFVCMLVLTGVPLAATLSGQQQLGKNLFFDRTLSLNDNQPCSACHEPGAGWTGGKEVVNQHEAIYEGSIPGRFGNRKPLSVAYAAFSPVLYSSRKAGDVREFIGGNFWDGKATGEKLRSPAADQAHEPFLNPLEQALQDPLVIVSRVCRGGYANLFFQVCGQDSCNSANTTAAFDCIALAINAYESSKEVSAFTSKFDAYLKGRAALTKQEREGFSLFNGNLFSDKAKCRGCHPVMGKAPLFTDFTYDNLGIPPNPENPFYSEAAFNPLGPAWTDKGLGGVLEMRRDYGKYAGESLGKFKVPTLRNVDKRPEPEFVKAYGHNGFFKSLKGIVHFYNTRDTLPACPGGFTEAQALANHCWPPPEIALNVNSKEMGHLGLTSEEEDAIVAFLRTLSDGYIP